MRTLLLLLRQADSPAWSTLLLSAYRCAIGCRPYRCAGQERAEHVLQALATAAETVQQFEFAQQHGAWVEAHQQQLPAAVVAFWQQAQQVGAHGGRELMSLAGGGLHLQAPWRCIKAHPSCCLQQFLAQVALPCVCYPHSILQVDEARYRSAHAVAAELQAAMRTALADGYVFVLPTTPGPAPCVPAASQGSSSAELDAFRQRCSQFAAVASLSGVPQAVLPLPLPDGMPLSISLLALHKRDLALLQAVSKLGPMLEEEAAAQARQQKGGPQAPWQPRAAAGDTAAGAARGSGSSGGGGGGAARRSKASAADAARAAEAEARKEEGNAAFRSGRYEEAARQYSAALQLDPRCAVYWANRAMANLKLGAYGAAEADCDEALKLELSAKALLRRGSARLAQVGGTRGGRVMTGRWLPCIVGRASAVACKRVGCGLLTYLCPSFVSFAMQPTHHQTNTAAGQRGRRARRLHSSAGAGAPEPAGARGAAAHAGAGWSDRGRRPNAGRLWLMGRCLLLGCAASELYSCQCKCRPIAYARRSRASFLHKRTWRH